MTQATDPDPIAAFRAALGALVAAGMTRLANAQAAALPEILRQLEQGTADVVVSAGTVPFAATIYFVPRVGAPLELMRLECPDATVPDFGAQFH